MARPESFMTVLRSLKSRFMRPGFVTITFANISGSMIFLGAVITRMKGEKLKTIAFGALGLLVLFVTNIYGIFTFCLRNFLASFCG